MDREFLEQTLEGMRINDLGLQRRFDMMTDEEIQKYFIRRREVSRMKYDAESKRATPSRSDVLTEEDNYFLFTRPC